MTPKSLHACLGFYVSSSVSLVIFFASLARRYKIVWAECHRITRRGLITALICTVIRVDAVVMGSWCNVQLVVWAFYYFLHFNLSEIIALASYLPVTPALPVTSASGPLPLDYSRPIYDQCSSRYNHLFYDSTQTGAQLISVPEPRYPPWQSGCIATLFAELGRTSDQWMVKWQDPVPVFLAAAFLKCQ